MARLTLPYPDKDFVPLNVLNAQDLDEMVANDKAIADFANGLASGANFDNNSIDGAKIKDGSIEPGKLKSSAFSQSSTNGWSVEIKPNGKKRYYKKTTISKSADIVGGGWDIIKASDLPAGITTQTPNVIFRASSGLRLNGNNSFAVALTGPYLAGGVNNFDVGFANASNANASIGTRDMFLEVEEI